MPAVFTLLSLVGPVISKKKGASMVIVVVLANATLVMGLSVFPL